MGNYSPRQLVIFLFLYVYVHFHKDNRSFIFFPQTQLSLDEFLPGVILKLKQVTPHES